VIPKTGVRRENLEEKICHLRIGRNVLFLLIGCGMAFVTFCLGRKY
jgi:hypothetical protein